MGKTAHLILTEKETDCLYDILRSDPSRAGGRLYDKVEKEHHRIHGIPVNGGRVI